MQHLLSDRPRTSSLTSIVLMAAALGIATPLSAQTTDEAGVLGPQVVSSQAAPSKPARKPGTISGAERINWIVRSTIGPESLAAGVFSSGWNTAFEAPPEYGDDWQGFGKRYGVRLGSVAIGSVIEGALGAAWGEDPRYSRFGAGPSSHRIGHALKLSVMAPGRDGQLRPSYARYVGIVGNNFISNEWRPASESTNKDALIRSALGVVGRIASNMFAEFSPDLWRRLARRK